VNFNIHTDKTKVAKRPEIAMMKPTIIINILIYWLVKQ